MRRSLKAVVVPLLLMLAVVPGLAPSPATAREQIVDQTLEGFTDLLWDPTHARLFVAEGDAGIAVFDHDGTRVGTVATAVGAPLTAAPDDSRVWTYSPSTSSIVGIDPTTLDATNVAVTGTNCRDGYDFVVRQVIDDSAWWLDASCGGEPALYRVDASGSATPVEFAATRNRGSEPLIPVPGRAGAFMVVDRSNGLLVVGSVRSTSGGGLQFVEESSGSIAADDRFGDAVVTADGRELVSIDGFRYDVRTGSLLGSTIAFRDADYVAVAPDGSLGYAGYRTVRLVRAGATTPWRTYDLDDGIVQGIALADDRLFEILSGDSRLWLRVVEPKIKTAVSIRIPDRVADYREAVTVEFDVRGTDGAVPVEIYALNGRQQVKVGEGISDADGHGTAVVRLTRSTRLSVRFPGDATHDSSATRPVPVRIGARVTTRYVEARSYQGRYAVYRPTDTTRLQVAVTPDHTGDCIRLVTELYSEGRWSKPRRSGCVRLGTGSAITLLQEGGKSLAGRRFRQQVVLQRDDDNDETTSAWAYLRFSG